ncbi:hypothetical protein [Flagellimonas sp. CMM7]|uniref:hypothetical protein n=1 Tax=Flagellimonas sp. CMM7 TaxID=2654676 RepID=UPI0013D4A2F0|nr:hypothetical protein [Flagellimonas sp. CMM7]UII80039.1 hypothetical protein LV704_00610 [Flagellimonas sp. CMM7]
MSERAKEYLKSKNMIKEGFNEFIIKGDFGTVVLNEILEEFATKEKRELLEGLDEETIDEIGFKWAGMHVRKIDERYSYQQGWGDCINHLKNKLKEQ